MEQHAALNYDEIVDGIFIGTNACCRLHMDQELLSKGIEADVSLEEERLDHPFGVRFYLWLPTPDHTPPSQEQMRLGVSVLRDLMTMKKKVYVHCKNGHGRAPTLVAAYLVQEKGMSIQDAMTLLKTKRPAIHFQESQFAALQRLEKVKR